VSSRVLVSAQKWTFFFLSKTKVPFGPRALAALSQFYFSFNTIVSTISAPQSIHEQAFVVVIDLLN